MTSGQGKARDGVVSSAIAAPDFHALFESAPGLFLVLTPDLRIAAVSNQYLSATMTDREKIVGRNLFDVFPDNPADPKASGVRNLRESLERVLRDRAPDAMAVQKYDIRRPDAEGGTYQERFWSPINSPVFGTDNELRYIIHRVEDVTEFVRLKQQDGQQRHATEELRKRANQMEADVFLRSQQVQNAIEELRKANQSLQTQVRERIAAEQRVKAIAEELHRVNQCLEARDASRTSELENANRALLHEVNERHSAQERFQLTVESAPNAMVMVDQTGRILLVNRQTEMLFGYGRDELLGQRVETLVPDRFRGGHPEKIAGFFANPAARTMGVGRDLFGQHRDGSEFPVEIGLNPIQTGDGLVVLSAIVDITERKRAEELQRQSDLRFRGIFDHTFGFIGLLNADGTILEVNKPALDYGGLTLADVAGRHLWETPWFDSPEARAAVRQGVTRAAAGEFMRSELTLHDEKLGQRSFDFTVKPVFNKAGVVELLISEGRDMTDQKNLEVQFRQAQKMEAVGSLAGGIAHEFNNLLQAIRGYTQFAIEGLSPGEPRYQDLELVLKSADRATVLTRQLLSFGRRQVLQRTHVDPNQVIADLMKLLRPLIGENIELVAQLSPEAVAVYADAGQLQQVLLNLCINARDAMPAGGRLVIRSQSLCISEGFCSSHPHARPGQHVLLSVADTGCGMTPQVKTRIFEPFFTTKKPGEGTGLGLAMVYGMVEQHGGIVDVYSEPNLGTTFKVYLPISARADAEAEHGDAEHPLGGKETILIAEDDAMVRDLTVRILRRAGYSVLVAADGAEAVELFETNADTISLALLDAVMPKLTGHQAYDRIKLKNPKFPVVFCSGHDPETTQVKLLVDQGVRMVQKPFDPDLLLRIVREVLDSQHQVETLQCTV